MNVLIEERVYAWPYDHCKFNEITSCLLFFISLQSHKIIENQFNNHISSTLVKHIVQIFTNEFSHLLFIHWNELNNFTYSISWYQKLKFVDMMYICWYHHCRSAIIRVMNISVSTTSLESQNETRHWFYNHSISNWWGIISTVKFLWLVGKQWNCSNVKIKTFELGRTM